MEDFEREVKVLVVGNGGVGKTSMITRFCSGTFSDDPKRTVGVDFLERLLPVPSLGCDVRLLCWDTAGQEEFDTLTRAYYRGAGAAVIIFSTTDRASFDAVPAWRKRLLSECGDIAVALVQNKVDLLDRAVVSSEEAEEMARRLGVKFYRSCVKEGLNVTEVFQYLAELHDRKVAAGHIAEGPASQGLQSASGTAWGSGSRGASGNGASEAGGGEATALVGIAGQQGADSAKGGKTAGAADSGPSKRRGQQTLGQRAGKAADNCVIS